MICSACDEEWEEEFFCKTCSGHGEPVSRRVPAIIIDYESGDDTELVEQRTYRSICGNCCSCYFTGGQPPGHSA